MLLLAETKEQLSEVEQQLKRAEAAQRRRIQNEKALRESEVCLLFYTLQLCSNVSILMYYNVIKDQFYTNRFMSYMFPHY